VKQPHTNRYGKPWVLAALGTALWIVSGTSSAACLQKLKQVKGVGAVPTFMLAPRSEVAEYATLGFAEVQCPRDLSVFRQYVEKICSSSTSGDIPVLNTEIAFGRSRIRACNSARAGLAESGG
jgi:hypothetical protein